MTKEKTINYSTVRASSYIAISLPLFVFAIGWLKWYWAVLVCAGLFLVVYKCIRTAKIENRDEIIKLSRVGIAAIAGIILVWVWLSGTGGFWAQSEDYPYRNAIFRDIILRKWPVIYEQTGHALVYYIGFWLVPALFGKTALLLGASDGLAFNVGNVAVFIWTFLLLYLLFLHLIFKINTKTQKEQILIVLLFIFFGGMDIWGKVGAIRYSNFHLEWWAKYYQYSSFTTDLFWVFNQAIPGWLCFALLLNEKRINNYVFIGMMCLFCAPIPFVGLFVYAVVIGISKAINTIKTKTGKEYWKDVVSLPNLISVFIFFPIIATYTLSNTAIHGTGNFQLAESSISEAAAANIVSMGDESLIQRYFSFICIEFLLYMICIWFKYKQDLLYYVTLVSLLIIPLIKIGEGFDFAMRASIPGLLMLFILIVSYLFEETHVLKKKGSIQRMTYILLVILLCFGAVTPGMEIFRGCRQVCLNGIRTEGEDNIYTLGCDGPYDEPGKNVTYANFVATDLENQIFFRVFCKNKEK